MKALEVFKKAKEEGKFISVNINMTVMRSNFREIPQFVELQRARGVYALLRKITEPCDNENIFELNDEKCLSELKTILSDPKLHGNDVDVYELTKYVPRKFHSCMGVHTNTIWYPSLYIY